MANNNEDRFSMQEFARRYKVPDEALAMLCQTHSLTLGALVTREEFKQMLDSSSAGRLDEPQVAEPDPPKEEQVINETRYPFAKLAARIGLDHVRVEVLKVCTGWSDDTKITEAELDAAINKHLKGKE